LREYFNLNIVAILTHLGYSGRSKTNNKNNTKMPFIHLHNHTTEGSVLDATQSVKNMVATIKGIGQSAVALTDHGTMSGAIKLLNACKQHGVKPIIGNEMYILVDGKKYHLTVLAKNIAGYKNLCKLTNYSHVHGWHGNKLFGRPTISRDMLAENSEGLIILSGCAAGELPRYILAGDIEKAKVTAEWFKSVFGDDYYLEIQDHGFRGNGSQDINGDKIENNTKKSPLNDVTVNQTLHRFSIELSIKLIATNDAHFSCADDWEAQTALLCINTKTTIESPSMKYTGTEYLKTEQEMLALFADHLPQDVVTQAVNNSQEIADKVEGYEGLILKEGDTSRMPKFAAPLGEGSAEDYLRKVAHDGLVERFKGLDVEERYSDRLNLELDVICSKEFADYFLVVWDYCKYCFDNNIAIGAGRGSAAGSLVAYSLRITNIDPIHHGLLFERFLNPERMSMPDIDIDFEPSRRHEVVDYVSKKYINVCQIGTFGTLGSKSALKDVFKVCGLPYSESDRLSKLIPISRGKPTDLKVMIGEATPVLAFREIYLQDEGVKKALDLAIKLDGVTKSRGVHAAGVVISPVSLDELVPVMRAAGDDGDTTIVSQYEMADIESLGLLKMDFLGLKNLTAIQKTINLLSARGINISADEIAAKDKQSHPEWGDKLPMDVERTYKMLTQGKTYGVFQLGNKGITDKVKRLKPDSIESISAISALYRPGPLDAGVVDDYISRKNGETPITYPLPILQPILELTFGCMVYQEQIMKIAQVMAGYSLGEADLLRRAMGKKKPAEMAKQRDRFVSGSISAGVEQDIANKIFDDMSKYAEYCFNASHSIAYSYISWTTAYLKSNYAADFTAALLSCDANNLDEIKVAIPAAKDIGINVMPPSINESDSDFRRIDEKTVRFGLSSIKGLGIDVVQSIISERNKSGEFKSFPDLAKRVQLTKRATDGLIYSGALDCFSTNRQQLIKDADLLLDWARDLVKSKKSGQMSLFDITANVSFDPPKAPNIDDLDLDSRNFKESEYLGICLNKKYSDSESEILGGICNENIESIKDLPVNQNVAFLARIPDILNTKVKNGAQSGKTMAFLKLADNSGEIEAVMFPNSYDIYGEKLRTDCQFLINGIVSEKNGDKQIVVNNICAPEVVKFVVAYINDEEKDRLTVKTAIAFSRGDLPLILWYKGQQIRTGKWVNSDAVENLKKLGITAAECKYGEIKTHFEIYDSVDMLANAKDWQTVSELSLCFRLIDKDYGATVWKHAPSSVKSHVNSLKAAPKPELVAS
jgi:DNA polymerase-3 subunit alpha